MSTIVTVSANPAIDLFLDVPAIALDEVLRATGVRRVWAGKGFNVSRTVSRLGHATVAMGFVGGFAGMAITAGLAEEGIPTDFVNVDGETRTNVMVVDGATGHHIKVNQAGAPVDAAAQAAFMARAAERVQPGDFTSLPVRSRASTVLGLTRSGWAAQPVRNAAPLLSNPANAPRP